jgi:large subunit ribosomal protein L24
MVRDTVKATTSRQPRKQRKARIQAPKNRRRKMMASPLSRELRERNEFYPRRLTVRKGDVVMVTRGGFGGHEGKVLDVDLKSMKVLVDGVVYQKADNTSIPKPIDPSNIEIIKLDLSDRRRKKKFERILEQSGLSEEEIREAEEELEATESLTISSYEEEEEMDEEELGAEDEEAGDEADEEPDSGDEADEVSAAGDEPAGEPVSGDEGSAIGGSDEEPAADDTEPVADEAASLAPVDDVPDAGDDETADGSEGPGADVPSEDQQDKEGSN